MKKPHKAIHNLGGYAHAPKAQTKPNAPANGLKHAAKHPAPKKGKA